LGLFLGSFLILLYPGLNLPTQRNAVYYLVATTLVCFSTPEAHVTSRLGNILLCVAIGNAVAIAAVFLPFPSLSIATARVRLDMIRRLLCLLLKTSHQAFELNEEVHFSTVSL